MIIFQEKEVYKLLKKVQYEQKNIPVPNKTQFESFASKFEPNIKAFVYQDLKESGIDPNQVINNNS